MGGKLDNAEAEGAFIGGVLLGIDFPEDVDPTACFSPVNRTILEAALYLRDKAVVPNAVTVHDLLVSRGMKALSLSDLASMVDAYKPWHALGAVWAEVVESHRTRRVLAALSEANALAGAMSAEDLVGAIIAKVSQVDTGTAENARQLADVVRDTLEQMREAPSRRGVQTGLHDLASAVRYSYGATHLVAGRPSMGKSSFVRTVALDANGFGDGVHYFTVEDPSDALAERCLSDTSGIPLERIVTGQIGQVGWTWLERAAQKLGERKQFLVEDTAGLSGSQIATRVRRHKRQNNTRVVVVDYIQLLRERQAKSKYEAIGISLATLCKMARDEGVALFLCSQLNRENEKREDKRPELSDLRESGELEQAAQTVTLMHRPEFYWPDDVAWQGKGLAIVAKNKHGRRGEVVLAWDGDTATYRSYSARAREEAA